MQKPYQISTVRAFLCENFARKIKHNTTERLVRESKGKVEEDGREWKLQSR